MTSTGQPITPDPQHEAICAAIRGFDFDDYRLDVNPNSEYAEWVGDLAKAIQKTINAQPKEA